MTAKHKALEALQMPRPGLCSVCAQQDLEATRLAS